MYIANPNFTGEIQLTANSTGDNGASISPDGTKIVFCRCDNAAGYGSPYNIYKMDIDGGNVVKLTTATGSQSCSSPYWSSDGTKILYSYNDGSQSDIYIMNSDGTSSVNQTSTTTHNERITDYIY